MKDVSDIYSGPKDLYLINFEGEDDDTDPQLSSEEEVVVIPRSRSSTLAEDSFRTLPDETATKEP